MNLINSKTYVKRTFLLPGLKKALQKFGYSLQTAASSGYKPYLMFDEVRDFSVSAPVFKQELLT